MWHPLSDDDAFRDDGEEGVATALYALVGDPGAGVVTVAGRDAAERSVLTVSLVRRPDEILCVVARPDGTVAWFTDRPDCGHDAWTTMDTCAVCGAARSGDAFDGASVGAEQPGG